jgi:hypothetical protein
MLVLVLVNETVSPNPNWQFSMEESLDECWDAPYQKGWYGYGWTCMVLAQKGKTAKTPCTSFLKSIGQRLCKKCFGKNTFRA